MNTTFPHKTPTVSRCGPRAGQIKKSFAGKKPDIFLALIPVTIVLMLTVSPVSADIALPPGSYSSPLWLTPGTLLQYEMVSQSRLNESQDYPVNRSLMNISVDLMTPASVYYSITITPADKPDDPPLAGSFQWDYGEAADPCFYVDPADPLNSVLSPDGRPYSVTNVSYPENTGNYQEEVIKIETKPDPVNTTYTVIFGKETGKVYSFSSVSADNNHQKEITLLSDL